MKKVIVIGASSGIGRELARSFVRKGDVVGITGRRRELLEELKAEQPESYAIGVFDVTACELVVEHLTALTVELGGLDVLVVCSGTGDINPDLDVEIEQRTLMTNVIGFTHVIDWGFNYFTRQQSGQLVGITSIGGLRGSRHAPAYNASKAFQMNYLEGLRVKARQLKTGVVVTDIRPGLVDTDMAKGDGLFWVEPVQKVSEQIMRAIEKKTAVAYVTGRWGLVARLLKLMPRFIFDKF